MSEDIFLEVKPLDNANKLKAQVDITFVIGGMEVTIRKFKLVETQSGLWLASPSEQFKAKGENRYFNLVEMPKQLHNKLQKMAIEQYEEILTKP